VEHLRPPPENQGLIAACQNGTKWLKFILALLIFTEVFLTCVNIAGSFDFPWQFAEGEFLLKHGYPERSVLNAYGEISPNFQNEYILYELTLAVINRVTGWAGVCVFSVLLCFLIYLPCLIGFLRSRYRFTLMDVCLFFLAQFLINMRLSTRPELIADSCYVLTGIMLIRWPTPWWNGRQIVTLGLIFCLWANAHGTFLLGLMMVAFWYAQAFVAQPEKREFLRDFRWMLPGLAAFIGCAVNPFGFYRIVQPFVLHSLIWGQATSLEMTPVTSGVFLLPLSWTAAAIVVLLLRPSGRKYYWLIAMLVLLQYLTFISVRYNVFIAFSLLIVTWDGLRHPREPYEPEIFPLAFAVARIGGYFCLVAVLINLTSNLVHAKVELLWNYCHYTYPKGRIATTSSCNWMREHPAEDYNLLSYLAAGSWAQMPGVHGVHPLIDSGTHRYSDRTNQLYYYSFYSPETFRLVLKKLNINALAVNDFTDYWATVLNGDPDWQLVQIEGDSQLYLRGVSEKRDPSRMVFSKWEKTQITPDIKPEDISSYAITRGIGLRPDEDSLRMLAQTVDITWTVDPKIVYVREWLDRLPDAVVAGGFDDFGKTQSNSSQALRIVLLLRLHREKEAAEIARAWHPIVLNVGYQEMEMLRAEAFLRTGDVAAARKILDSFWPKPRFSLRWARLCQQVYRPEEMPKPAVLLLSLADEEPWKDEIIETLNQNITRLDVPNAKF
jgi:hypothetical protein